LPRNKKGQIQSQVFVFILAMVVIGLMFFFGYKWFNTLMQSKDDVMMVSLRTTLKNYVSSISYGDGVTKSFQIPGGYRELCFVDISNLWDNPTETKWINTDYPIMWDSANDKVQINTFLVGKTTLPMEYVGNVTVIDPDSGNHYICRAATNGYVSFKFQGNGEYVTVS
jgi:hypothetical protein